MINYTVYKGLNEEDFILRENENGTFTSIPVDPANSDYQAYLNKDTLVTESAPTA